MYKLLTGIYLFILFYTSVAAQVTGWTVDSQTGIGLEGASILTNTGKLFTTNSEGFFSIPPDPENLTELKVSFVGYKSKTVIVPVKSAGIKISLEAETQNIKELVLKIPGIPASLINSTGSVSFISSQNLQNRNNMVLNDAINMVPGVYMSGGSYNTNRLTIRGIGSRSPYSSNRIRAYLDDIPLTSGDGTTTLEDIDMASISSIEILKGPSSAIYGSGLGGAVRILSFQPQDEKFSISVNSEISSFGTYRSSVRTGLKTGKVSFSLVFSNSHSEGYRQNSQYTRNSLLMGLSRTFNNTRIKLTLLYIGVDARIPSSVNLNSFKNSPELAAANWLAIKGYEQYKKILLGLSGVTKLNERFTNNFSVSSSYLDPYESRPFNILDENSKSIGSKEYIQYSNGKIDLLSGVEIFSEAFNWKIFETDSGNPGNLVSDNRENRFYINTFALSRFKNGKNFTADLGFNLNILKYSLNDIFNDDSIDLSGDYTYRPEISPRLGVNIRLSSDIHMHASIGHGFSAPSLEETLLPDGQVNSKLKPESGWNFDIGVRGKTSDWLSYDVSIYHIALINLLVTKRISEEIFTGINAGKTSHSGIETQLQFNLLHSETRDITELTLITSFAASLNQFKDFSDNGINYSGLQLPGIPSLNLNNELNFKVLKFIDFTVFYKFVGRQFLNDANTVKYEGWQLTDFRINISKNTGKKKNLFQLYAGVRNLFNKNYSGMILVNAPSFGTVEPRYYYPGLPRNYFAGILVEFK